MQGALIAQQQPSTKVRAGAWGALEGGTGLDKGLVARRPPHPSAAGHWQQRASPVPQACKRARTKTSWWQRRWRGSRQRCRRSIARSSSRGSSRSVAQAEHPQQGAAGCQPAGSGDVAGVRGAWVNALSSASLRSGLLVGPIKPGAEGVVLLLVCSVQRRCGGRRRRGRWGRQGLSRVRWGWQGRLIACLERNNAQHWVAKQLLQCALCRHRSAVWHGVIAPHAAAQNCCDMPAEGIINIISPSARLPARLP